MQLTVYYRAAILILTTKRQTRGVVYISEILVSYQNKQNISVRLKGMIFETSVWSGCFLVRK